MNVIQTNSNNMEQKLSYQGGPLKTWSFYRSLIFFLFQSTKLVIRIRNELLGSNQVKN